LGTRPRLLTTKSSKGLPHGKRTALGVLKRLLPKLGAKLGLSLGTALPILKRLLVCLRAKLALGLGAALQILKGLLLRLLLALKPLLSVA
jgi:hypothetical protein